MNVFIRSFYMILRARNLDIDAGDMYIVILNERDARKMHVLPGERVDVSYNGNTITAVVDTSRRSIPRVFWGYL